MELRTQRTQRTIRKAALLALLFTSSYAFAAEQSYLGWTGLTDAWKVTRGAGVKVALLNTGVNYHLPEFRGRIARDADGSYGFDAVGNSHDPMDLLDYGLGTQVASIVAGNQFGVAPEAELVPVRVFDENGGGTLAAFARGVRYAVDRGVRVLEVGGGPLSLGREGEALCGELQRAERADVLLLLPAGNSGEKLDEYPEGCTLRNAVTVAATDPHGELTAYSNFGFPAVQLAALGEGLWRVTRDGSIRTDGQGTSFSSAFAAGVAALIRAAHPEYSAGDVKTALIRGAVARETLRGKVLSNGVLNAALAIGADISRPE